MTTLSAHPRDQELSRRQQMRRDLLAVLGRPNRKTSTMSGAPASALKDLYIYRGGHGIYVDKPRTTRVSEPGVTVSLLHTGSHYDDDLSADGVIYHYPVTEDSDRDADQIQATKNAMELQIPVFVIVKNKNLRDVHIGWILDYDDEQESFLVGFTGVIESPKQKAKERSDSLFEGIRERKRTKTTVLRRAASPTFRFEVLKRYGITCSACDIQDERLVDAAHVIDVEYDGVDDARNGIPLCPTHHRAFDARPPLLRLQPETLKWKPSEEGPSLVEMGVTRPSIGNLSALPHGAAVDWRWRNPRKRKAE